MNAFVRLPPPTATEAIVEVLREQTDDELHAFLCRLVGQGARAASAVPHVLAEFTRRGLTVPEGGTS